MKRAQPVILMDSVQVNVDVDIGGIGLTRGVLVSCLAETTKVRRSCWELPHCVRFNSGPARNGLLILAFTGEVPSDGSPTTVCTQLLLNMEETAIFHSLRS
jgi:hypothetical protein